MHKILIPVLMLIWPGRAQAHVSERALVMLLPTEIYIPAGVAAVAVTVLILMVVPAGFFARQAPEPAADRSGAAATINRTPIWISTGAFVICAAAVATGIFGPRDPLTNGLTLLVWTVFWIILPVLQALFGNLWAGLNPWTGPYRLLGLAPLRPLPGWAPWIGCATYFAAALYSVIHIAPDDPERLAVAVALYWAGHMAMMLIYGADWITRAEGAGVFLRWLAAFAPVHRGRIMWPGARLIRRDPGPAAAVLIVLALGIGSFDGLNETFWWLGQIGINPLAFPGRSAVILPNGIGLVLAAGALLLIFFGAVWIGAALIGTAGMARMLAPRLALSLVPIALGYHIAHYLTAFLVNSQYLALALTDPLARGADYLGLGPYYVSTGFFNTPGTVQIIWLIQGGAIVLGHMLAVLLAHAIALDILGRHRDAVISQIPLACFMVFYTFFGLWLLAAPTGA